MNQKVKKAIWGTVAGLCVCGLAYIYLIGLPVSEYIATNDEVGSQTFTVQLAPFTFFDVDVSANEVLVRTDGEAYFQFENATLTKTVNALDMDPIDLNVGVYGNRNGQLCRTFENCVINVNSNLSTWQPLQSLLNNSTYVVAGNFEKLTLAKEKLPTYSDKVHYVEVMDGVWGEDEYLGDISDDMMSYIWCGDNGSFYKVDKVYGLNSDIVQQLLAKAIACYNLDIEEYYAGETFTMFKANGWTLGVRSINMNTQLMVVTNDSAQRDAALKTLYGVDEVG